MNNLDYPTFFYFLLFPKLLYLKSFLEFAIFCCFFYGNCYSNSHTNHRIVSYYDKYYLTLLFFIILSCFLCPQKPYLIVNSDITVVISSFIFITLYISYYFSFCVKIVSFLGEFLLKNHIFFQIKCQRCNCCGVFFIDNDSIRRFKKHHH